MVEATEGIAGSREQFERAVRPVLPRFYRFCLALTGDADTADDVLQNTLVKAYTRRESYAGRGEVLGWLCGIARNEHLETRRTDGRRRGLLDRMVDAWVAAFDTYPGHRTRERSPESEAMETEASAMLLRCMQELPEEFRAVVALCDIEELSYERVAEILDVPIGTVKSRHSRARTKLRAAYDRIAAQGRVASPGGQAV